MTNVYIMQREDGLIKIGRSRTPSNRRVTVQAEVKQKVELLKFFPVGDLPSHCVERKAHDLLLENRVIGEWFETSFQQAASAIKNSISFVKKNGTNFNTRAFRDGKPSVPVKYFNVPLPKELYNAYKNLSKEHRRTVSNQILVALEFAIENPEYLE